MKETVLRDFFERRVDATALAQDLTGSETHPSPKVTITHVEGMEGEFAVTREMATRLCDAVLNGQLRPESLRTIGFGLVCSDHFTFDGEDVLGEVLHDWACPEVNYPLTIENVKRFKLWLEGLEPYPPRPKPPQ